MSWRIKSSSGRHCWIHCIKRSWYIVFEKMRRFVFVIWSEIVKHIIMSFWLEMFIIIIPEVSREILSLIILISIIKIFLFFPSFFIFHLNRNSSICISIWKILHLFLFKSEFESFFLCCFFLYRKILINNNNKRN